MNIAIVGATGNVGRKILQVLEQKKIPIDKLYLVASLRSTGQKIEFNENLFYILIFLALFPSIGSYYCWAGAVSIIGANRAGIFLSLIPLFSTLMAIFFYNEQFQFFHLIGAILIILGLFLSNKEIKNA